jgi:DNA-binding NarL/FixJ family response regulator
MGLLLGILVVDDFAPWRIRVRAMLQTRPEWQVVGEACDGLEAVWKTMDLRPHIVLLDIEMPNLNGIEAAKRIRAESRTTRIIFLTQQDDADIKVAALATGADAYLLKRNAAYELLPAIKALLSNYKPTSPDRD